MGSLLTKCTMRTREKPDCGSQGSLCVAAQNMGRREHGIFPGPPLQTGEGTQGELPKSPDTSAWYVTVRHQ